jgi:hypothetical protein
MEQAIIANTKDRLRDILYFNYSAYEDTFSWTNEFNEPDSASTTMMTITDRSGRVLSEFDAMESLEIMGSNWKTLFVVGDGEPSEEEEHRESVYNIRPIIARHLKNTLLDFIRGIQNKYGGTEAVSLLTAIKSEVLFFQVTILEEDPEYISKVHSSFWGGSIDSDTAECFQYHHSPFSKTEKEVKAFGRYPLLRPLLVSFSLEVLSEVLNEVVHRVDRLIEVLPNGTTSQSRFTDNGLFLYQGENQVESLINFLQRDNDNLIPSGELEGWLSFLSGKSLPKTALTWTGAKSHLVLLIKYISELQAQKPRRPLPIELISTQPPWRDIIPIIKFKDGEPMEYRDVNHSTAKLKKSLRAQAKYIQEFIDSYQGEY